MESLRIKSMLEMSVNYEFPFLIIGPTGIGKTQLIQSYLKSLIPDKYMSINLNFSARTSSSNVQNIIDSKVEKKRRDTYGPRLVDQKGIIFIDDLNLPMPDKYGFQPPIELMRQFHDQNGYYDMSEQKLRKIVDFTVISSMKPPGGVCNPVSKRLLKYFITYSSGTFDEKTMVRIFTNIMQWYVTKKGISGEPGRQLIFSVEASVDLYNAILDQLKPIPKKCHYLFNLRDLSKICQGMQQLESRRCESSKKVSRLWLHECKRVLGDRLIAEEDEEWLYTEMTHVCRTKLRDELSNILKDAKEDFFIKGKMEDLKIFRFTDVCSEEQDAASRNYDEVIDTATILRRQEVFQEDFNSMSKKPISLTLFEYAMDNCIKICRTLRLARGNASLLGLGGSGRQTLTKLATYITDQELVDIQITKAYNQDLWKEDARALLAKSATEGKNICLLISEAQARLPYIMEDVI